jgi:ABC-type multidrug transport system fused ATPase/permease subunit
VSLDRVNSFLHDVSSTICSALPHLIILTKTELLDSFAAERAVKLSGCAANTSHPETASVGICKAFFSWTSETGTSTPSQRNFLLRIEGELLFPHNKITVILGPTGCGKTSLLMALLGEFSGKYQHEDIIIRASR